jgi:hypothetical protein
LHALNCFMASVLVVAVLGLLAEGTAHATTEGRTSQGEPYVSGGVGLGERDALNERSAGFSLSVTTAAKGAGAYLADVKVTITNDAGNTVLDTRLDGPSLLVNLKPGRYVVEAVFGEQTQRKSTTVHPGDHHEMLFHFELGGGALSAGPQSGSKAGSHRAMPQPLSRIRGGCTQSPVRKTLRTENG